MSKVLATALAALGLAVLGSAGPAAAAGRSGPPGLAAPEAARLLQPVQTRYEDPWTAMKRKDAGVRMPPPQGPAFGTMRGLERDRGPDPFAGLPKPTRQQNPLMPGGRKRNKVLLGE